MNKLNDCELDLARQNPLADKVQALSSQQADFDSIKKSVFKLASNVESVLERNNIFCSRDSVKSSPLRDDLMKESTEINNKFKNVRKIFFLHMNVMCSVTV